MSLKRSVQIGFRLETDEGVSEASELVAADFARTITEYSQTSKGNRYERDEAKAGLSKSATLMGAAQQEIPWTEEMAGGGKTVATAAKWHDLLQACGFGAPTQLKKVQVGTETTGSDGGFVPGVLFGDNAVQGSATKTGRAVGVYVDESSISSPKPQYLVYEAITGVFGAADTAFVYAASGTQTSRPVDSVPTDCGTAQRLLSETDAQICKSATVEYINGGQAHRAIGARGDAEFMLEHNKPPRLKLNFRGVKDLDATGSVPTKALVASVPVAPKPYVIGKRAWPVLLDAFSPVVTKINIALNNTLADRPSIGTGIVLVSSEKAGYLATRIGDRNISAEIDPEHVAAATYDFYGKWQNESLFKFYQEIGVPWNTTNGLIVFTAPTVQFDADDWTPSDRDGLIVHNPKLKFTGDADEELVIYHILLV